jgi:hypothetical protein
MIVAKVPKYTRYCVTPEGDVYVLKGWRKLKPQFDKDGYVVVGMSDDIGGRRLVRIHRIVAMTYLDNPCDKPFVNHINGIKADNRVENLEWCTAKENSYHAIKTGLFNSAGENNPNSKISLGDAHRIRNLYATGLLKQVEIAKLFGISQVMVGLIVNHKNWREKNYARD